jgi:hypothetical protein
VFSEVDAVEIERVVKGHSNSCDERALGLLCLVPGSI